MTQISAEVIADSVNAIQGCRLTTMRVVLPRHILAELNTHRMFSRNSASSRAIPFEKMVQAVESDPFVPIAWQKDHKGMQGTEYITDLGEITRCEVMWHGALANALVRAESLHSAGVTKQLCNRLLEPFMWHTVLISATEWGNFFSLRCPKYEHTEWVTEDNYGKVQYSRNKKDYINTETGGHYKPKMEADYDWLSINKGQAEIHMMALAEAMDIARDESKPRELKAGEWHIPFGDQVDEDELGNVLPGFEWGRADEDALIQQGIVKVSTARCARVSYTVAGAEGKEHSYEDDIKLHDRLAAAGHWSPFEHCARVMTEDEWYMSHRQECVEASVEDGLGTFPVTTLGWSGNFRGFVQYRKLFPNENRTS